MDGLVTRLLRFRQWESGCGIAVLVSFAPPGLDDVGALIPGLAPLTRSYCLPRLRRLTPCRSWEFSPRTELDVSALFLSPFSSGSSVNALPRRGKRHIAGGERSEPPEEGPNNQCAPAGAREMSSVVHRPRDSCGLAARLKQTESRWIFFRSPMQCAARRIEAGRRQRARASGTYQAHCLNHRFAWHLVAWAVLGQYGNALGWQAESPSSGVELARC
jgi:hypothetical protein